MAQVRPKKQLGQHFLKDQDIAARIVAAYHEEANQLPTLEIGPGMGVLSELLIDESLQQRLVLMDLDRESIAFLSGRYVHPKLQIVHADFLRSDLNAYFGPDKFGIIGNFPYNISSQIFFKVLDYKQQIPLVVGMLQKEVAERMAASEGNKTYGILSVLIQAYYMVEYLFTVPPHVFDPPPKVQSGVIRLIRNQRETLPCDEKLFVRVVKAAFQTRRKTLRNALKTLNLPDPIRASKVMDLRAEQLSVEAFIELTREIEQYE